MGGLPATQSGAACMGDSAELSEVKGFDSYPVKLGDSMRGERATLGKSLLDVQRELRIKAAYISAIERCDPSAFQTPGFVAGYVRSYARYLGLDPEATFAQFCVESDFNGVNPGIRKRQKEKKPVSVVALTPVESVAQANLTPLSRTPIAPIGDGVMGGISASAMGSVLVLLVLIMGIGYGAWAVLQDIQRVEFAPAEPTSEAVATLPDPLKGNKTAALDQLYRQKELDVPVMTPRDGPIAGLDPSTIGALVPGNGQINARETAAKLKESVPRVTEKAPPVVAIVASRPAWVRVSQSDGTILFERILDGGEGFQLPPQSSASVLRAGNSGAVYLTMDGVPYGPIGNGTSVVKHVALGPADIYEKYQAVNDKAELKALDSPRVITLNDVPLNQ